MSYVLSDASSTVLQERPAPDFTTTRSTHAPISRLTERVSRHGSPPSIKTEAPRQTGPESRVTGRETPVPPAYRRWVPPSLRPQHGLTQEAQNDAIFRKVRGILNKLTPENFQKLSDELLKIDLNTKVILQGVIHLLFEKALDEPKYSSMYAQLCKRLSVEAPNFDENDKPRTFLTLLLNVCRDRFLNRSSVNHYSHDSDDEEKKHIAKQKMLGNVKFIGELSKLDMLSDNRLHTCILQLLDKTRTEAIKDRCEDMECLSQLIRTCGKNLDTEKGKSLMDQYFEKMASYSQSPKFPPRIRFMLRDVIELRNDNWVPRKVTNVEGPMPMNQLQPDDDNIMLSPFVNRNRNQQNNDSEPHNWMNKMSSLNLQQNSNEWNGLSVTSSSHYTQPYNSSPGNYNNRDYRDGGGGRDSGGYGRHNNQRNNQNHNSYNNHSRYGNNNNGNNIGGGGNGGVGRDIGGRDNGGNNKHNNQHNNSHNSYNNSPSNMMNNKDLAPRFKRNLITPPQDPVETLTFRPAANSLLFKANVNIKASQLPLTPQPRPSSGTTTLNSTGGLLNNSVHHNNSLNSGPNSIGYHGGSGSNSSSGSNHRDNTGTDHVAPIQSAIKMMMAQQPVNSLLNKDQILIKQASLEKPKQNKKDKGPNKEEVLKRVQTFLVDNLLAPQPPPPSTNAGDATAVAENGTEPRTIADIVASFLDLKVPDKHLRDTMTLLLNEVVDKPEAVHERVFDFLVALRKESKFNVNTIIDGFKALINGMAESTVPRIATLVASLLSRAVNAKLCKISDVGSFCENGQHYPLLLLVLQQLHKTIGKTALIELFNESKVNLMTTLPDIDRTKNRMAEILTDRTLSFLYPLLKLQGELQKQIQVDPNPQHVFRWIKDNVEPACYTDPGFITALMTVLLKYITQETTLKEGIDRTKQPDKALVEQEKQLLERYCKVLQAFLHDKFDLQLVAIYALQVFCDSVRFPRGMLLRWFTALYELNVIHEDSFLRWKEDLSDAYPGKGNALFQVNSYLTWLEEAESEDDDEDDD